MTTYFPLEFSHHAREAMSLRAVTKDEVFSIARTPEIVEYQGNERRLVRGPLTVVVAQRSGRWVVITVLLRAGTEWTNTDARTR